MNSSGSSATLAPGYRFHPTDEELVRYFLKRKVFNMPVRFNVIAEVDIYKYEPWDLSDKSRLKNRDQEWFFFTSLDKKHVNSTRLNRATKQGYWKSTGKDREIHHNSQLAGMKKTLVFHHGRAPGGLRTDWVMHEYRLVEEEVERTGALQGYVLCKVFHKNIIGAPIGSRYAPFIEEEWDNEEGSAALVHAGEDDVNDVGTSNQAIAADNVAAAENAIIGSNGVQRIGIEQDIQNADEDVPPTDCPPLCVLNKEAQLPVRRYKRRRHKDSGPSNPNGSEKSTAAAAAAAAVTTTTSLSSATTAAVSALLELSLMEPIEPLEPKDKPYIPPHVFDTAKLDSEVPLADCLILLNQLQNKVHKGTVENENLKLEMMSAQSMINILMTRIDGVIKENEDIKRMQ